VCPALSIHWPSDSQWLSTVLKDNEIESTKVPRQLEAELFTKTGVWFALRSDSPEAATGLANSSISRRGWTIETTNMEQYPNEAILPHFDARDL
jgi:hypothetical protein